MDALQVLYGMILSCWCWTWTWNMKSARSWNLALLTWCLWMCLII